jgi:integrase/recombinase XerD
VRTYLAQLGFVIDAHALRARTPPPRCTQPRSFILDNPVKGVKRPRSESGEGKTPALGDHQARELLAAPGEDTVKDKRDRAILSTLLYHALRREELCKLKFRDFRQTRRGVPHLKVSGKGEKTRYLPLHPGTAAPQQPPAILRRH